MTDWFLALVPHYGGWLVAAVTFFSCLALPIPSSLVMLAAGAFAATGDLGLATVIAGAFAGAVAGDQAGYAIGRRYGAALLTRARRDPRQAAILTRAEKYLSDKGGAAVFLSRWLFSPLGPWLNFAAGAAKFNWRRFTGAGIAGEVVWVIIYVGMGHFFGTNLERAGDMISSVLGVLAGLAAMLVLAGWLRAALADQPG